MMLENIESLIIIAGCQRSGTTLTGQIFGAHPKALLVDETDGLYKWFNATHGAELEDGPILADVLMKAANKYRPDFTRIHLDNGKRKISPNVKHLILKAPNLTYSFERIANIKIPVQIIFPVRDPRSVVASMAKLQHIDMINNQIAWMRKTSPVTHKYKDEIAILMDNDIADHVKRTVIWRIKSGMSDSFHSHGLAPFVFKYESLVADTESVCKQLVKHTGLKFDPLMLNHETVFRGMGPGFTERSRPVDNTSIRKWATRLSDQEEADVLKAAGALATSLNYGIVDSKDNTAEMKPKLESAIINSPVILSGRGGSGTRLISEIAQSAGLFLGNRLNVTGDSTEWVDILYELGIVKASQVTSRKKRPFMEEHLLKDKAADVLGYGNWKPGQVWGWKLPETMLIIPELMASFTNAKFVHLVRHPVTSSLRRTHMTSRANNPIGRAVLGAAYTDAGLNPDLMNDHDPYMHNAITWLFQVRQVHRFSQDHLSNDNYLQIRFEDLCSEPKKTTKTIVEFIGGDISASTPPMVDSSRRPTLNAEDPRIDEVWELCGEFAQDLGYKPYA